jgi:AraC-like DNA-binding protein
MLVDIDWRQTSALSKIWRLIPYGKISALFVYGDPHQYSLNGVEEGMAQTRQAFLVGQLTKPIWLKFSGHTRLIKIQFKSSGLQKLFPMNMEEFKNVPSLDLEAVWGKSINELLEQLHESCSDEQRIQRLNYYLEKRLLPQNSMVDYIDYTIGQMKKENGNISIKALEQQLGISTRQIERLFRAKLGLSPKEMSKIIRLNSAFSSLEKEPDMSLTSLAYQAGYYDQSHFTRDFKGIAGVSPTKLLSHNSNELFVTHGQCFVKNNVTHTHV